MFVEWGVDPNGLSKLVFLFLFFSNCFTKLFGKFFPFLYMERPYI